jgi:hypothetical protein
MSAWLRRKGGTSAHFDPFLVSFDQKM